MKTFLVENTRRGTKIKIVLHNPPYENENILYKPGYKEKDCLITEVHSGWAGDVGERPEIDNPDINGEKE